MGKKYLTFRVDEAVKEAYMSLPDEWKRTVRDYLSVAILVVSRELARGRQAQVAQAPPQQA